LIAQIMIALFGVTAVWLTQDPRESRRRYACLFGLAAQPFWYWATWEAGQYGIFALCTIYTLSWMRGFHHHWIKK
jgi:hypothetical protein